MIAEWKDITKEKAPTGEYVEIKTGKGSKKVFHPVWVYTIRKGEERGRLSYFIPDESRWNGYTKKEGPTHWDYMPDGPE